MTAKNSIPSSIQEVRYARCQIVADSLQRNGWTHIGISAMEPGRKSFVTGFVFTRNSTKDVIQVTANFISGRVISWTFKATRKTEFRSVSWKIQATETGEIPSAFGSAVIGTRQLDETA